MQSNKSAQNSDPTTTHSSTQIQHAEPAMQESALTSQQMATGGQSLPAGLQTGLENLSGYDLGDVRVHYNSSRPEGINAWAYAQGADIHLAPGQERHLPHEAWHVVQQMQGRVEPTVMKKSMDGEVGVNDSPALEQEADVMGEKAQNGNPSRPQTLKKVSLSAQAPVQRLIKRQKLEELDPPTMRKNPFRRDEIIKGRYKEILKGIADYHKKLEQYSQNKGEANATYIKNACNELIGDLDDLIGKAVEKSHDRPYLRYLARDASVEKSTLQGIRTNPAHHLGKSLKLQVLSLRDEKDQNSGSMYPGLHKGIDMNEYVVRDKKRHVDGAVRFALGSSEAAAAGGKGADFVLGDGGLSSVPDALDGKKTRRDRMTTKDYVTQAPTEVTATASALGASSNIIRLVHNISRGMDHHEYTRREIGEMAAESLGDASGVLEESMRFAYFGTYESKVDASTGTTKVTDGALEAKIASGFGGAKGFFYAVKSGFTLAKTVMQDFKIEEMDYSQEARVAKVMEGLNAVLVGLKSVVDSVVQIWVITRKGVPEELLKAIPGLDVAISAINLIMRSYYLLQSRMRLLVMQQFHQDQMGDLRQKYRGSDEGFAQKTEQEMSRYRAESTVIALRKKLINQDIRSYKKKSRGKYLVRMDDTQQALDQDTEKLESSRKNKVFDLESLRQIEAEREIIYINEKRINRNLMVVAEEITTLTGSVLVLSGAGTGLGAGLRAGSAAASGSRQLTSGVKSKLRDIEARKYVKGKVEHVNRDISKSRTAKKARYRTIANTMLDLVATIRKYPDDSAEELTQFHTYLYGIGLNPKALLKIPKDKFTVPLWQAIITKAMERREMV